MSKKILLMSLFLSLFLVVLNLTIYTPHLIYFAQPEYFEYPFWGLVSGHFFLGLVFCLVTTLGLSLLPSKLLKILALIFFSCSILFWVYADYFAVSYGVLDGSEIKFEAFSNRVYTELLLLLVAVILTVVFYKQLLKNSVFILVMINAILLITVSYRMVALQGAETESLAFDDEFNQYSSAKNIIIIILDNFGNRFFQQAIKDNPEFVENYQGFVAYTDAISNYSATTGSVPSMLTGKMVPRDQQYIPYLKSEVAVTGMQKTFEDRGFEVSLISPNAKFKSIYPKRFLSHPKFNDEKLLAHHSKKLLDYALFRAMPHHFKPHVFNEGKWFFSSGTTGETVIANTFSERGKFLLDYVIENTSVKDERPRFKVIHATLPHPEYVYDQTCNEKTYDKTHSVHHKMLEQSKCALELLDALLDKYKAMGIYDQSLIVVTSDHGDRILKKPLITGFPSSFEMNAAGIMFMIKGLNQTVPFKEVHQPFSLLKLKEAVENEQFHETAYDHMVDNNRLFYAYRPVHLAMKGYMQAGPLYQVEANHELPESWQLLEIVTNGCSKLPLPLTMKFGKANRSGYCGAFWFTDPNGKNNGIWTKGEDNRIIFSLDKSTVSKDDAVHLIFQLKPLLKGEQKSIDFNVIINGYKVGNQVLEKRKNQTLSFAVDEKYLIDGQNELQLLLPGVQSGQELGVNKKRNRLGVFIEQITIE